MKSRLFIGEAWHARREPVEHAFQYPICFLGLDLKELTEIDRDVSLLGYNRRALLSVWDKDYLEPGEEQIESKLLSLLQERGVDAIIERIVLFTVPRFFGYVFNPVNFYLCYGVSGAVEVLIAEVNNTFHERHLYVLQSRETGKNPSVLRFQFPKEFYVSPFFDVTGEYEILLHGQEENFDIRVNLIKDGKQIFGSRLSGNGKQLSTKSVLAALFRFPPAVFLTMARIHWQALKLCFVRKLNVYEKPELTSSCSFQYREESVWLRLRHFLIAFAKRFNHPKRKNGEASPDTANLR